MVVFGTSKSHSQANSHQSPHSNIIRAGRSISAGSMPTSNRKGSSNANALFEQPLEKIFNLQAIEQLNEIIGQQQEQQIRAATLQPEASRTLTSGQDSTARLQLCSSLSNPLTSSLSTWAKFSKENNPSKRKRTAARLRRFTLDSNNNNNSRVDCINQQQLITTIPQDQHILHNLQHQQAAQLLSQASWPVSFIDELSEEQQANQRRLLLDCLSEPIECLLRQLYLRGPSTLGIFRKSPNAKHCKELRQKLESLAADKPSSGQRQDQTSAGQSSIRQRKTSAAEAIVGQFQVNVIASVFKEWLRSLPDCLLMSRLYPQWIDVAKLIEPLHAHQQQQQQQRMVAAGSEQSCVSSSTPFSDNGQETKIISARNTTNSAASRPISTAASPLTDNGEQQQQTQLARALSCAVMTSSPSTDSGHSSSSPCSLSQLEQDDRAPETASRAAGQWQAEQSVSQARRKLLSSSGSSSSSSGMFSSLEEKSLVENGDNDDFNEPTSSPTIKRNFVCGLDRGRKKSAIKEAPSKSDLGRDNNNEQQVRRFAQTLVRLSAEKRSQQQATKTETCSNDAKLNMTAIQLHERRYECIRIVRQLLETMNEPNLILLKALICVLWHIAQHSDYNKMSSNNLGVCVGQSLLNDSNTNSSTSATNGQRQSWSHSKDSSPSYSSSSSGGHKSVCSGSSSNLYIRSHSGMSASSSNTSSAFRFTKRAHRRTRSQCLLASTLSLTNLSSSSISPKFNTSPGAKYPASAANNGFGHSKSQLLQLLEPNSQQEAARYVPILLAFMIDESRQLFGQHVIELFGPEKPQEPEAVLNEDAQTQQHLAETSANSDLLASQSASSSLAHDRRHLSSSVLVHVGRSEQNNGEPHQANKGKVSSECATTSILIVQDPSPRRGLMSTSRQDERQHQQVVAEQRQQRPLSVTGSTVSSSSTSGVHSESPAFSSSDSSSCAGPTEHHHRLNSSSASSSSGNCCSSTSSVGSISSPSPSSGCTSPICGGVSDNDQASKSVINSQHHQDPQSNKELADESLCHIEVTRDQLARRHSSSEASSLKVMDEQQRQPEAAPRNSKSASIDGAKAKNQRPASMLVLDQVDARHDLNRNGAPPLDNGNSETLSCQSYSMRPASHTTLSRQQSSLLVSNNRMPKIPFQYTTSSYGGQAVLFYPSQAHLAQKQRSERQFHSLQQATECHHLHHQQQLQLNRQQQLPAAEISQRAGLSDSSSEQSQQPPRSHVMMLRDYYLSLQRQSQAAEHQRQMQLQRQEQQAQRALAGIQFEQQQRLFQQQPKYSASLANLSQLSFGGGNQQQQQQQQLVQSAVQVATARPRLAKIRANQFNSHGLYVKHLASVSTSSREACVSKEAAEQKKSKLVRSSSSSHLMAVTNSSGGSAESPSASSSSNVSSADESEEWMQSTMV